MSTLAKVTLGLVTVVALCFFYLAARTLRTHEVWRTAANNHIDAIDRLETKTETLVQGDPQQNQPSIPQLEVALHETLAGRGRVWRNVSHRANANGVQITVDLPDPHKIEVGAVVHAFDMPVEQAAASYMGEFKATQVNGKDVMLEPAVKLFPFQVEAINKSRSPWTLYEVVPADGYNVFAGLNDAQLTAILPQPPARLQGETDEEFQRRQLDYQQMIREYLKHGKPAAPEDPPERVVASVKLLKSFDQLDQNAKLALEQLKIPPEVILEGQVLKFDLPTAEQLVQLGIGQEVERLYQRKLRDFGLVLRQMSRQLPLLVDRLTVATEENKAAVAALADAKKHETFNQDEIAELKTELERMQSEAKVVADYRASLEAKLQKVQTRIDELFVQNQQLADQLARVQLEAVGRGDQATAQVRLEPAR